MSEQKTKLSNEPIFWGLFGMGGTWSAIFFPVTIILVAFILPFVSPETMITIVSSGFSWLGRLFLALSIILPLWCGLHRVHLTLHDLKIHVPAAGFIFYGLAALLSVIALYGIFTM